MRRLCMKLICNGRPAPAYGNGCVFLWRVGSCRGCDHSLSPSSLLHTGKVRPILQILSLSIHLPELSCLPLLTRSRASPCPLSTLSLTPPPSLGSSKFYISHSVTALLSVDPREISGWMSAVIIMWVSDLTTSFISCIAGLALTDQLGLNEK